MKFTPFVHVRELSGYFDENKTQMKMNQKAQASTAQVNSGVKCVKSDRFYFHTHIIIYQISRKKG